MELSVGISETHGRFMVDLDGFVGIIIEDLLEKSPDMIISRDALVAALQFYRDSTKSKYYETMVQE